MMIVIKDVAHGASHYARREYNYRNGEVNYLVIHNYSLGYGSTPRKAINDLISEVHPKYPKKKKR